MIWIAVVDDENSIREQIKFMIKRQMPDCVTEVFETGSAFLASEQKFDLVFLDIRMDVPNGIRTAKMLRARGSRAVIIFITALKDYVFEAFDVSAFYYLLKPLNKAKFLEVLTRAVKEIEQYKQQEQARLCIKTGGRNISLCQQNILYIESHGKKVKIHTQKENFLIYSSMGKLEEQLENTFYRCHRGYLVNMAYVAEYTSDSIGLSNGETIFLAKEKYSEFVKTYMRYLRDGGGG